MKKLFFLTCLFLTVFILHARAIQEDIDKADEKARLSYAFGMLFGSNLRTMPLEFDAKRDGKTLGGKPAARRTIPRKQQTAKYSACNAQRPSV